MNPDLNFPSALNALCFKKLTRATMWMDDCLEIGVSNGREGRHEAVAVGEDFQSK